MAWEKASVKWIKGNIQPEEDFDDVVDWLLSDPVWKKADEVEIYGRNTKKKPDGTHFGHVHITGMSQFFKRWSGDHFDLSSSNGGRRVKKWIVEQLVNAYKQLLTLE